MKGIKTLGLLLLTAQLAIWCWDVAYSKKKLDENNDKTKKEMLVNLADNKTSAESALYITKEPDSILYFIFQKTNLYNDIKWESVFLEMPAWMFLRKSFIDKSQSDKDYLCINHNKNKYWIKRDALKDNNIKSENEFYKPSTEKVIILDKTKRKMMVYDQYGKNLVKEFKIALSPRWNWDKTISWDWNTPEWRYYICNKNPVSSFWKNPKTWWGLGSLMVSYPNIQDWIEWLITGEINKNQYNRIKTAINNKSVPSQDTQLGNYIMIHWWGSKSDWTAWCAWLENEDMLWLFLFINTWTDLFIK